MPNPPFTGNKQLILNFDDIVPLIDKIFLFQRLWQFPKPKTEEEQEKIDTLFEQQLNLCRREKIIVPQISYGFFPSKQMGNGIFVDFGPKGVKFDFPREASSPNFCLADVFEEFMPLALVTVGVHVQEVGTKMFTDGKYSQMFYLKGLAAAAAEATMEYVHKLIRKETNTADDVGRRYSLGYPCCPQLADQKKILKLLEAEKIDVKLTSKFQLIPEHSITAFIALK